MITPRANVPNVGAMDPELRNSPVVEETDEEGDVVRLQQPGEPVCYFNGREYANGVYVRSGDRILHCRYGVWVEEGPGDPLNP